MEMESEQATIRVATDVGGTFTDFSAVNDRTGETHVFKRPSTPDDPSRAILHGLRELAEARGIALGAISRLAHGTTVATNALLQGKGGRVALVTTEGFGRIGAAIAAIGRPLALVQEGGYVSDALGANLTGFLQGVRA